MPNQEAPISVTLLVSTAFDPEQNKTVVIVYCPELDMEGAGFSREEAEERFRETVKANVAMAKAAKSLKLILTGYGWTEKDGHWVPPVITVEKTTVAF
ncbi:MAG: hypothetical protein Q8P76_03140 [bacterium]|nr:hypothetical protein [bacterium]